MPMIPCTSADAVDALLADATPTWLMKHSNACGISHGAHAEVLAYAEAHGPEIVAVVVVQHSRPLCAWIAQRLGFAHQSPQLFLLAGGTVAWRASHHGITRDAMERARQALAPA